MNCKDANKKISLLVDGLLNEENERLLREHMNVCKDCKKLYDDMKGLTDRLSNLQEIALPEGLENKIHFALKREAEAPKKKKWIKYTMIAMPAAVTVFAVVLGISFVFSGGLGGISKDAAMEMDLSNVINEEEMEKASPKMAQESIVAGDYDNVESKVKEETKEEARAVEEESDEMAEAPALEMLSESELLVTIEYGGSAREDMIDFVEYVLVSLKNDNEIVFDEDTQSINIFLPSEYYEELLELVNGEEKATLAFDNYNQDVTYDKNLMFEVNFLFQKNID